MRLLLAVILAAVGGFAAQYLQLGQLRDELAQQRCNVTTLSADIDCRNKVITRLQDERRQLQRAELELRRSLTEAGQSVQRHEQRIQGLLSENQSLRHWANSALPDAVSRLHQRPAFHSTADYLRWLSEGDKLPDTGKPSENSR